MSGRFRVIERSQTGHCCFNASVLDTTKPILGGDKVTLLGYEAVCECFSGDDAQLICVALNEAAKT